MKVSPSKENILKRVRNALSEPVQLPFPNSEGNSSVFKIEHEGLEIKFAEEFSKVQGKFIFCENEAEANANLESLSEAKQWQKLYCNDASLLALLAQTKLSSTITNILSDAAGGITSCELLVARTGSIVISAAQAGGRAATVFPPVHIVVAYTHQLVFDIKDGLLKLKEKYPAQLPSMISFQSGPSRTADIEKTLVVGVHGPREVYVFLIDQTVE